MKIDPYLAQVLRSGQLVVFCGAGLSHLCTAKNGGHRRLPLWLALTQTLAHKAHVDFQAYSNLLDVYDGIVTQRDRPTLESHLREEVNDAEFNLSAAHRLIKDLPWHAVVTTNYDNLLARVLQQTPVVDEQGYDRLQDQHPPTLFHLHGDRYNPHTLTGADFRDWAHKHPIAWRHLEQLVLNKTLLFIGYGLGDAHFNELLTQVNRITQGRARRHYAWLWQATDENIRLLDARNRITATCVRNSADWAKLLRALKAAL